MAKHKRKKETKKHFILGAEVYSIILILIGNYAIFTITNFINIYSVNLIERKSMLNKLKHMKIFSHKISPKFFF